MAERSRTTQGTPGSRFKPYPAHKDSGVEWLGEIPAHWEVRRRAVPAQIKTGRSPTSELVIAKSEGYHSSREAAAYPSEAPREADMVDGRDLLADDEEELPDEPQALAEEEP